MVVEFVSEEKLEELIAENTPLFVEFWCYDCLACEIAIPFLNELATGYEGRIRVVKIDAQKYPSLMKKYIIRIYPTFIFFNKGNKIFEVNGFRNGIELEKKIRLNLI